MSYSTQRRTSAADFEAARPLLGISEQRMEAARLVMVEGQQVGVVAARFNWTPQAVSICVRKVWEAVQAKAASEQVQSEPPKLDTLLLPPGWEQATFIAPVSVLDRWRAELAQLKTTVSIQE